MNSPIAPAQHVDFYYKGLRRFGEVEQVNHNIQTVLIKLQPNDPKFSQKPSIYRQFRLSEMVNINASFPV